MAVTGNENMKLAPGPKTRIPGMNLIAFRRHPLEFFRRLADQYGDISRFRAGATNFFLLNRPDYIRDVLVTHNQKFMKGRALQRAKRMLGEGLLTSEGDFHRRQRRLAQPAFHKHRIAGYADVMSRYAARTSKDWTNDSTVDVAQEMMRLTLAIVAKTLFDYDVESESGEIGEALTAAFELFSLALLPFSELLEKFPFPATRRFEKARGRLDATIFRIINERRRSGRDHGDLLSMLLMATDEENEGDRMTDVQLRDEVLTLFLAGHETTANALTWTWYLLSQNPDVEAKLHAELDHLLGGRAALAEDYPRLGYTEMVFAESMRLYPPAWVIGRRALEDYEVDGYTIPARSIVIMSQYVMHRDARFFPEPERFDPERWNPGARAARPKFSYFPFGAGPRQCIGESFAWMEGVLLVATIAQHWKMRLVPGHPVEMLPRITLRPRYGMRMTLHGR